MAEKLANKVQTKFRSGLVSIFTYIFFLGIGYLVALFIEIPQEISYPIFFLFGILAVSIDIPDDKMVWLKRVPLLRRHFSMMHRVRQRIGISAKEGKISSAFKFVVGLVIVTVYLFWMNLMILSIKYILKLTIDFEDPFRFTEAFLSLLGAGITAFLIWMRTFHRDYKRMRTLFKSNSRKDKTRSVGKALSIGVKLYALFIGYGIWIGGEILFMLGTKFYESYLIHFLVGFGGFFVILVVILILIGIMTKPGVLQNAIEEDTTNLL